MPVVIKSTTFQSVVVLAILFIDRCFFRPCPAAQVDPAILDNLEAGYLAFLSEDYEQAVKLYTQVIRNKRLYARDRAVTYLLRGEALMQNGRQ